MSHFPDREDPVDRFKSRECVDCGEEAVLGEQHKFDYWTSWAYEKGHEGEESHLWIQHEHDWRCVECAEEFYPINRNNDS